MTFKKVVLIHYIDKGTAISFNDTLVCSKTQQQPSVQVRLLLHDISQEQLQGSLFKCIFGTGSTDYVCEQPTGDVLSADSKRGDVIID